MIIIFVSIIKFNKCTPNTCLYYIYVKKCINYTMLFNISNFCDISSDATHHFTAIPPSDTTIFGFLNKEITITNLTVQYSFGICVMLQYIDIHTVFCIFIDDYFSIISSIFYIRISIICNLFFDETDIFQEVFHFGLTMLREI